MSGNNRQRAVYSEHFKNEKWNFEEAFLLLKSSKMLLFSGQLVSSMFVGKNRTCRMIELSGNCDSFNFDGNTISEGRYLILVITNHSL